MIGRRSFFAFLGGAPFGVKAAADSMLDQATPGQIGYASALVDKNDPRGAELQKYTDGLYSEYFKKQRRDTFRNGITAVHPSILAMRSWSDSAKLEAEIERRVAVDDRRIAESNTIEGMIDAFRKRIFGGLFS